MKKYIILFLLLIPSTSWAVLDNCNKDTIEAAILAASPGDTIELPPCEATAWDDWVTVDKALTIKGQTTTSRNATTYVVTPTDSTIITGYGFTVTATSNVTITGFTFQSASWSGVNGAINLPVEFSNIHVYGNHFNNVGRILNKTSKGVKNLLFYKNRITEPSGEGFYITGNGNTSWSDGGTCGSSDTTNTTWIEDNEFIWVAGGASNPIDQGEGARSVWRYNRFTGRSGLEWGDGFFEGHGHCMGQKDGDDNAGAYCIEVSGNKFENADLDSGVAKLKIRGGKLYVYKNSFNGNGWSSNFVRFWIQETDPESSCNSAGDPPCNVQAHEDMGIHSVPLSDDPNFSESGGEYYCDVYPCPMQINNSYIFGNTADTVTLGIGVTGLDASTYLQRNREWWDDIDGVYSEGTSLPGTCTVHDLYWNTSTKVLSRCTSTDNWTTVYTAYTYPHPLRDDAPDTTAPADPTYAINAAGSSFTVTFSEAVTHRAGGTTGWVLTSDGGVVTATYSSGAGSTALVYQLSRTVYSTETVTGTYTQPTDGIEDTAGNDFATVTDVSITNNSTATSGAPTYPKMTLSTGSNVTLSPSGTGSFTLAP